MFLFTNKNIIDIKKLINGLSDSEIDEELYCYLVDLILSFQQVSDIKNELMSIKSLPEVLQAFLVTKIFQNEVDNGGYAQFFFNSHGYLIYNVYSGFKQIGLDISSSEVESLIGSLNKVKDLKKGVLFALDNNTTIESYYGSDWERIIFPPEQGLYQFESEILKMRIKYIKDWLITVDASKLI